MFTLISFSRLLTICFAFYLGACSVALAQADSNLTVNAQLLVAARQADAESVKKSLDRGAAPNSRNRSGKTSLFLAIEKKPHGHCSIDGCCRWRCEFTVT